MSTDADQLSACGCCEPNREDRSHVNAPGQAAIAYRIGTHPQFLERMRARVPVERVTDAAGGALYPLAGLTGSITDDPVPALLDAWSAALDVLTFYQERIANEVYLRTATERRSVLELARAIGYELNPGVAATAYLAFTVDPADTAPGEAVIAAGTQVMSIPQVQDERPQIFETMEDFTAYAEWNELRPRLTTPQEVDVDAEPLTIYVAGTSSAIVPGDMVLVVTSATAVNATARKVLAVTIDTEHDRTRLDLDSGSTAEEESSKEEAPQAAPSATAGVAGGTYFTETEFQARVQLQNLDQDQFTLYANRVAPRGTLITSGESTIQEGVFVLRERLGLFGHNAPPFIDADHGTLYDNWDSGSGLTVYQDSRTGVDQYVYHDVYLERSVRGLSAASWLVLEAGTARAAFWINAMTEASLVGYAMSAKCTGLTLYTTAGVQVTRDTHLVGFHTRETTAFVRNERLELAETPIEGDITAGDMSIELGSFVPGLSAGQAVILTGELKDQAGVTVSELLILEEPAHNEADYRTTLFFATGLQNAYARDTVTICANVVRATHGETVSSEVLGSGKGSEPNQRFVLKRPPLTHVSAATPTGGETSLAVRVNGVAWDEAPSLYGLDGASRSYIVRIGDDQSATVTFGDGLTGARLPTGLENIAASYRTGIGSDGSVDAETLTLLKKKPLGVKGVTNPLAASGAADPEDIDDARTNAPLKVLTLDRVVSVRDFEDFARAFSGIGKAAAVVLWEGRTRLVHVTVADTDGNEVDESSDLYRNLRDAMDACRDPSAELRLATFTPRLFVVEASVRIDDAYEFETVRDKVVAALTGSFSFAARAFGQSVTAAEIMSVAHTVEGVIAVDIDTLQEIDDQGAPMGEPMTSLLQARPAHAADGAIAQADLLLIHATGIEITEAAP